MDSEPKFTEENKFEWEEWFEIQIKRIPSGLRLDVITDISSAIKALPLGVNWIQEVYGVVGSDKVFFYMIEYINNRKDEVPLLIDFHLVDTDDYLDAILNKNTIKYYAERINTNREN